MSGREGEREPDPRSIVAFLRRRASMQTPHWPSGPLPKPRPRPPVAADPALAFLHAHWVLPDRPSPQTGPGWRRRLRAVSARLVFAAMQDYLAEERELLSHLVQVGESLARSIDALESDVREMADVASIQLAELLAYVPEVTGRESAPTGSEGAGQHL